MNFRTNILLIFAIVVAFLLINFSLNPKPSGAQQNVKWEYTAISSITNQDGNMICKTDYLNHDSSKTFNELGKEGWELVLYHDVYGSNEKPNKCKEAIFKKPLK